MREAVLITGVSSGTGRGMAKKFLAHGYRVVGSVRREAKARELQSLLGPSFSPLVFDVRNADELDKAQAGFSSLLAGDRLVALINNAGGAEIGPLLHISTDELRAQLDTLVVGQLAVIQRFYEHLIPAREGQRPGKIVNISSVSGQSANPYFGAYAAGKHALEGLSKTLRAELRGVGIPVVVVAPEDIATSLWSKQTNEIIEKYRDTPYYPRLQRALQRIRTTVAKQAMSVEELAQAVYEIVQTAEPADRYTVVKRRSKLNPLAGRRVKILER